MERKWDHHDIIAEIHRSGMSVADFSRKNGVSSQNMNAAFKGKYGHRGCEIIIATFLGTTAEQIWPERFAWRALPQKEKQRARFSVPSAVHYIAPNLKTE